MKKLTLACAMLIGSAMMAQQPIATTVTPTDATENRSVKDEILSLTEELELTEEQTSQVAETLIAEKNATEGYYKEIEGIKRKISAVEQETNAQMKAILTPEQLTKYRAMQERKQAECAKEGTAKGACCAKAAAGKGEAKPASTSLREAAKPQSPKR